MQSLLCFASAVAQVCAWVGNLEEPLRGYRNVFEDHDVDGEVLLKLNHSLLKDMGIVRAVRSSNVYVSLYWRQLAAPLKKNYHS